MADEKKAASRKPDKPDEEMTDTPSEESPLIEASEKGFMGVKIDPTPDDHYTVEGVTAGKPTPETDHEAYEAARQARRDAREFMTPEGTSRGREAD